MTISAISSSNASSISTFQQDRQAFNQLTSALQSGDLTTAQSAYNTLASSPMAQGNGPFAQAIQQIGKDLQAGDPASLADAQKVLSSLQQARGHHHHHHGGGEVSSNTNASDSDGNSADNIQQIAATDSNNAVDIKA